ncbi:ANTHESIS POMOTING FACTOR 1-like protein [Drosera capensis]
MVSLLGTSSSNLTTIFPMISSTLSSRDSKDVRISFDFAFPLRMNLFDICPCMIIGFFDTSKATVTVSQGILRLRGKLIVAYEQQGLVFAVSMEGGAVKLFDSRSYDKGPFDTFLVGGDTAEAAHSVWSHLLTPPMEAVFTPDCQYILSGSGDGNLHAWHIHKGHEVARWNSEIGVASCLKWAPRRAMFVSASTVLTFWIPDYSKLSGNETLKDPKAAAK